jgi:Dolichyl-phosphate-mannose-protein mannosyltransferase
MTLTRQRFIAFLFPLLLALPFLNRAYFVDDSYFVQIGTWLKDHPREPYHFRADDAGYQTRGWEEDGFVRMVNPLAHHYYLALLMKLGGAQEWFLRLGCVLLACFSGFFIFEFARRWTASPLWATLIAQATPALWLTSYSLLIDATMGFCFFAALYFFIRCFEMDRWHYALLSGVFMGLTILSKYPGLLVIPVTASWLVLNWKKASRKWPALLAWVVGLSFLWMYSQYTAAMYGRPHILAASARMVHVYGWAKILSLVTFFSGCALVPLVAWGWAGLRRGLMAGLAVFILIQIFSSRVGGFTITQSFLLGLWVVTSFLFTWAWLKNYSRWIYPRDYFLFVWTGGFILMMIVVMGWVAARYYVIVIPPVVFVAVRLVELTWPAQNDRILRGLLASLLIFTGALAYADYRQAETSRQIIHDTQRLSLDATRRHFYLGDSFTGSYLKENGWVPCFEDTQFYVGDYVLAKEVTMPSIWFFRKPVPKTLVARFVYGTRFPLKVMDNRGSAGFYASVWGALPFTISSGPWETFDVFQITGDTPVELEPARP